MVRVGVGYLEACGTTVRQSAWNIIPTTHHNTSRSIQLVYVARVMFVTSAWLVQPQVWSKGLNFEWLGGLKSERPVFRWRFLEDKQMEFFHHSFSILDIYIFDLYLVFS